LRASSIAVRAPTGKRSGCPAAHSSSCVSSSNFSGVSEKALDLDLSHPVEIVGHRDLSGHESEPANLTRCRRFKRHHLD
jgi:hypothetical protein